MFSSALRLTDLNDFITPSQACVKPAKEDEEDAVIIHEKKKVEITLGDCLACSGCITSAESVLLSKQSFADFAEILNANKADPVNHRVIVVSLSHQAIASIAASYSLNFQDAAERTASYFASLGADYIFDITLARHIALTESVHEFTAAHRAGRKPLISSICPGFVCYIEKTHGIMMIPHMSRVKSPQQIMGSLVKEFFRTKLDDKNRPIYHVTLMPCYDKKLEASRREFAGDEIRGADVDCVLTPLELDEMLASTGLNLTAFIPRKLDILEPILEGFQTKLLTHRGSGSGGWAENVFRETAVRIYGREFGANEMLKFISRRNKDFLEVSLESEDGKRLMSFAIVNGFRNIQTLIQRMKRGNLTYDYVEIMACPSGCLNGGGMIRGESVGDKLSDKVENIYRQIEYVDNKFDDKQDHLLSSLYKKWFNDEKDRQRLLYTDFNVIPKTPNLINVNW